MKPPFKVTDRNGDVIGEFYSIDDAKRSLPKVRDWRQDAHRELGWIENPAPFRSVPDYMITFVSSSKDGAARAPATAEVAHNNGQREASMESDADRQARRTLFDGQQVR